MCRCAVIKILLCKVSMNCCISFDTVLNVHLIINLLLLMFLRDCTFLHLAVATTGVDLIYSVAFKRSDFEINPTELNNVSHSQTVGLVLRTELLEYFVN